MRRTTICRSDRMVRLAGVALSLMVGGLRAQDTTHVDTTPARDTTAAPAEPPPPAPAPETYQTIFDRTRSRTDQIRDILRAYANQPYRPLRRGEYYSAGWLTEKEQLPWADVLGTTAKPAIYRLSERT